MGEPGTAGQKNYRETVKLICGFLTGIALTSAIEELAHLQKSSPAKALTEIQCASFFYVMCLNCRFFFGNIGYLNEEDYFDIDQDEIPIKLILDGVTIVLQSLLLAYMAMFTMAPQRAFAFVCFLFGFDFVWWCVSAIRSALHGEEFDWRIAASQGFSVLAVVLFLFWGSDVGWSWSKLWSFDYQIHRDAFIAIVVSNTLFDAGLNGPTYFGFSWELIKNRRRAGNRDY